MFCKITLAISSKIRNKLSINEHNIITHDNNTPNTAAEHWYALTKELYNCLECKLLQNKKLNY